MIENIEIVIKSNAEKETNPLKDLRKEINGLKSDLLQLEAGTEEYNAKALELANATKTLKDINEEARFAAADLGDQLATTNRIATGLASGFSAVQGVMALFGAEGENLQKIMVKLQAGIALVQGLQGMEGLVRDLEIAKIQFRGGLTAVKGFIGGLSGIKKALLATGIGAFIVLIGTLIANWEKISKLWNNTTPQEEAKKKTKELRLEIEKLAIQSAADKIARIQELSRAYQKLGDDLAAKKKFIREYAEELEDMGIEMNDVNDAEEIFRNKTKDYCNAVMARAKADAARQAATTLYAENMSRIAELKSEITTAQEDLYEYGEANQTFWQWVDAYFSRRYGKTMPESYAEDAQALIDTMSDEVTKLQKEADDTMAYLFAFANEQDALANQWLTGGNKNGNGSVGSSSSSSSTDDPAAEAKRIAERAKQALIDTKEEELAELTRIYNEELALLQQHNIATSDLTKEYLDKQTELLKEIENFEGGNEQEQLTALENFYNERIRIYTEAGVSTVELTAQFEAEKNAIIQNYENQRQEALTQIANDSKTEKELEIQELTEEYNTYLELFKNHKEQLLLVEQWYKERLAEISDKYREEEEVKEWTFLQNMKDDTKALITNTTTAAAQALSGASQILSAIAQNQDQTNREGFEKSKKLQVASATMNMLAGITSALSGLFTTKTGPWDLVLAGIQAATIATTGGIQIANIKKQTYDGSGSENDISIPNVSATMMPNEVYANQLSTQTEIDLQSEQTNTRVYVVESDITETQNSAKTKVSESEF